MTLHLGWARAIWHAIWVSVSSLQGLVICIRTEVRCFEVIAKVGEGGHKGKEDNVRDRQNQLLQRSKQYLHPSIAQHQTFPSHQLRLKAKTGRLELELAGHAVVYVRSKQ